jgi:hypothetical protein
LRQNRSEQHGKRLVSRRIGSASDFSRAVRKPDATGHENVLYHLAGVLLEAVQQFSGQSSRVSPGLRSCHTVLFVKAEVLAGQSEHLALGLDVSGAAHLLVLFSFLRP